MRQRLATILATTAIAALLCAPAAFADGGDDESRSNLATFLAVLVVIVSAVVMSITNRHFKNKREANQRKNRERAKKKKRK